MISAVIGGMVWNGVRPASRVQQANWERVNAMESGKQMTFRRYGQSYHLHIATAAELMAVLELDQAHWVATNAPINAINCDRTFLSLMDTDKNGRIICQEVRNGIGWLLEVLGDHEGITQASERLRLGAVNCDNPEGKKIHEAAAKMLRRLGRPDAEEITLEDIRQIKAQVESQSVSEAGVILPEAAEDAQVREFISEVIATVGGVEHPGGALGVDQGKLDEFVKQAEAFLKWHQQGEIPPGKAQTEVMPLGAQTAQKYAILASMAEKIEQYFAQCTVLALGEKFGEQMGWTAAELQELDLDEPGVIEEVLRKAPLAKPRVTDVLDLGEQINPYYVRALERFGKELVPVVVKEAGDRMTSGQWGQIKDFFGAHKGWVQGKPSTALESLGVQKLRSYVDGNFTKAVQDLIAKSKETAFALDNIRLAEKAVLYQAYMISLANNFVSFPHLYDPQKRAMFEMGTLVMDGRRFNLAVNSANRAQHAKVAKTSNMYVLYVEVAPKDGSTKYEVAVPVTSGGRGNLCLGKRGVFYDLAGTEADAKVMYIIENPVSLVEALLAPFLRLGRMLTGKIESITAEAEKKFDSKASTAMSQATAAPAAKGGLGGSTGGMLLGAGVAMAALGSALAYITKTLAQTNPLAIIIGVLVAVLAVMLPISIVAYLKLRKRDISAILEGSGWGINARMRLTRKQGKFFSECPRYPEGSKGIARLSWRLVVVIIVLLAILIGGGYLIKCRLDKAEEAPIREVSEKLPLEKEAPLESSVGEEKPAGVGG
ncbi:MAG: hypothetical protein KAT11_01615 [Phycisphaerae bacterium]|nr:hypothetical protein [Phycisphaerae bacterium]